MIEYGIYVIPRNASPDDYVLLSIARLRKACGYLLVVTDADAEGAEWGSLSSLGIDDIVGFDEGPVSILSGYRKGLLALRPRLREKPGHVLVADGLTFGPFCDVAAHAAKLDDAAALLAPYFHAPGIDPRYATKDYPERVPYLDLAVLSKTLVMRDDFWAFWSNAALTDHYEEEFRNVLVAFARYLEGTGLKVVYPYDPLRYETAEPRLFEADKMLAESRPFAMSRISMVIDPLLSDLYALNQKAALDAMRKADPEYYGAVSRFLVKRRELRDIHAIADEVEVLHEKPDSPRKQSWSFGTVGVFIHAFYANMMPEFWELISRLPPNFQLYVSTATEENKALIEDFLDENQFPATRRDVRVVEQNRGRDMGALFITFRDVILEDRHEVCLRLHSKRTPQVSRQVAESFKAHLFDNLVYTNGYVRNLYDLLEAQPDIGLIMPPTIHIGFGTLGHAWFSNREPFIDLAREMGVDVPFDLHTPLAPYGTMYWFRSRALRRMFEWPWQWGKYNPEPMHVDGGLAHVQERLIPYVAQQEGYRVISIMNRHAAARGYAKLEYKLQRLASQLPTPNIVEQFAYLQQREKPGIRFAFRLMGMLTPLYQTHVMTRPWLLKRVRPLARGVRRTLLH